MDVRTSAVIDGVAGCLDGRFWVTFLKFFLLLWSYVCFGADSMTETDSREPSVSTILMNFENKFDPYDAMSTPLYQTATFKQVNDFFTAKNTYSFTTPKFCLPT